jgi:hypothetical protein
MRYIKGLKQIPHEKPMWFKHEEISHGGELRFQMTKKLAWAY